MELRNCTDNCVESGGRGPVPSFSIGSLLGLQSLEISTDHGNLVRDRVLFQELSCLTQLTSLRLRDMPIESQSLPTALPTSLQHLQMEISDGNNGIPMVIEALTNLQSLCLAVETHNGRLTRLLTPFLEMTGLTSLEFESSDYDYGHVMWQPQALQILGHAVVQIVDSGSRLQLRY